MSKRRMNLSLPEDVAEYLDNVLGEAEVHPAFAHT